MSGEVFRNIEVLKSAGRGGGIMAPRPLRVNGEGERWFSCLRRISNRSWFYHRRRGGGHTEWLAVGKGRDCSPVYVVLVTYHGSTVAGGEMRRKGEMGGGVDWGG